jgi:hypothetical protein
LAGNPGDGDSTSSIKAYRKMNAAVSASSSPLVEIAGNDMGRIERGKARGKVATVMRNR